MERFIRVQKRFDTTDNDMLWAIRRLPCVIDVELQECTAEDVNRTIELVDCLTDVAKELYKLEDGRNPNCNLRALREQIEAELERDVTSKVHKPA